MSIKREDSQANKAIILASSKGYFVNKQGIVIGLSGQPLTVLGLKDRDMKKEEKVISKRKGYGYIMIADDGQKFKVYIHRLVAYQKFGALSLKNEVRHLDNNEKNNSWDNIAIGSKSQNNADLPEEFRKMRAQKGADAQKKLTPEKLLWAKEEKNKGRTQASIAIELGVSSSTLSQALNGHTYKNQS